MRAMRLCPLLLAGCTGGFTNPGFPTVDSRVMAISLASGAETPVSNRSRGDGPACDRANDVALDAAGNRLLVPNQVPSALFAIDLATGDRTILADHVTGAGPVLAAQAIALDPVSARAFAIAYPVPDGVVYVIDLATGDRTIVSGLGFGSGPALGAVHGLALDFAGGRAFVTDVTHDGVVAVDLGTGDRTVVSDAATGSGPLYSFPADLVFDAAGQRLLVLDSVYVFGFQTGALFAVDLATGDRTPISDATTGSGPPLEAPSDLVLDEAGNAVLVIDGGRLLSIDLATGDRTVIAESVDRGALALDTPGNRVLIATGGGTVFGG